MADVEPNIVRVGTILCGVVVTIMTFLNLGIFDVQSISLPHATYETIVQTNGGAADYKTASVTYTMNAFSFHKDGPHSMDSTALETTHSVQSLLPLFYFAATSDTALRHLFMNTALIAALLSVVAGIMLSFPSITYRAAHMMYVASGFFLLCNWTQGQRVAEAMKSSDEHFSSEGTATFDKTGTATMNPAIPVVIGMTCGLTLCIYPFMRVRTDGYSALIPDFSLTANF